MDFFCDGGGVAGLGAGGGFCTGCELAGAGGVDRTVGGNSPPPPFFITSSWLAIKGDLALETESDIQNRR